MIWKFKHFNTSICGSLELVEEENETSSASPRPLLQSTWESGISQRRKENLKCFPYYSLYGSLELVKEENET